jgi:hypothetical protein
MGLRLLIGRHGNRHIDAMFFCVRPAFKGEPQHGTHHRLNDCTSRHKSIRIDLQVSILLS